MSGPASQPYHHGNLRAALLERARETLAAEGPDALTLRRLARELGVSHAAPGRHFRDRRALLDALALQGYAELNARLEAAVDAGETDAGPGETDAGRGETDAGRRFSAVARTYVGFAREHRALLEVMTRAVPAESVPAAPGSPPSAVDADQAARLRSARRRGLELTASALRGGDPAPARSEGSADDPQRTLVAFALIRGLGMLAADDLLEGQPIDDLVDRAAETIDEGARTEAVTLTGLTGAGA